MDNFNINQKIEIVSDDGKKISSTIHDKDGDKIYISVVASDLTARILRPGEDINGILYCEDKLLAFTGTITNRILGDIALYEVSNIDNLSKAQRRKAVRVTSAIDMKYTYNKFLMNTDYRTKDSSNVIYEMDRYLRDGLILDISASGARIYISEDLKIGKELLLIFSLKDEMIQKGTIVYKDINMLPTKTTYFYGIEFNDVDEKEQEQIMSYVFLLMRKNTIK